MRKNLPNLLLAAGLFTMSVSVAQPTLTAAGINATVGNSFVYNTVNYISQGAAGANQTWDLSSATTTTTTTTTDQIVNPSSTPNASSFTSSNICQQVTAASNYFYLNESTTAMQVYGSVTNTVVMAYSNPEDLLHYPFTYTNNYTDTWATTFTNAGATYTRTGADSITADSYGTLKLPYATFGNVLRVHVIQNYTDNTTIGGTPFTITYRNDEYIWYLNGNHYPMAVMFTLTTNFGGGPTTSQGGSYLTGAVAGIKDDGEILTGCNLYPNPATGKVTLAVGLVENKRVGVQLFNSIGMQVNASVNAEGLQGDNTYLLDVTTLPEGIYFAQVSLDGVLATTKRFIVTK